MRLYFNLDTDRTIRFRDMDAPKGTTTYSVTQRPNLTNNPYIAYLGEDEQVRELAQDLRGLGVEETGYTFSSDLDFPKEYGFMADDDAHRIVAKALTIAVQE